MANEVVMGYLGPENTNTHRAAKLYLERLGISGVTLRAFYSITSLLHNFANKAVDFIIVPIENTVGGEVDEVIPWFFTEGLDRGISLHGEVVLSIIHRLLILPGASVQDIKRVFSKNQALLQCLTWINSHNIIPVPVDSTSAAAEQVISLKDPTVAAIAPAECAGVHLEVSAEHIMNVEKNETRFIVMGHSLCSQAKKDKTTVMFVTNNEPGALYHALGVFFYHNINLTRVDSWTSRRCLGGYTFWIDFENSVSDAVVESALEGLKRFAQVVRVVGQYPVIIE